MGDNVRVAVRCRPFNSREKDRGAKCIVKMNGASTTLIDPDEPDEPRMFTFDFSYWSFNSEDSHFADQTKVFNDLGRDVLDNAWNGYNVSLFAYGQTGAGKSYSMVGYGPDRGIIPLACEELFDRVSKDNDANIEYRVEVSMLEIYCEKIKDLLNSKKQPKGGLKVRENPKMGVYVDGLSKHAVASYAEVERRMEEGTKARTVASTQMNATSSRAHTVFTLFFTQIKKQEGGGPSLQTVSKINLVDLAGSERADSTGATGARLKEGSMINKSLTALTHKLHSLGNVISALADVSNGKKGAFVPYRNSVLTRLLQESLGGNAKTIMIAAVSPADINFDETLSTLRYADRAKQIKNKAKVNESPTDKLIKDLRAEIDALKAALATGAGTASQPVSPSHQDNAEIQAALEATAAQLKDMTTSWDDKLKEEEAAAAERERALSDMGLSLSEVGGAFGVDAGTPHLLNLNQDPLISNCLVYFVRQGETTVGRPDATPRPDIPLGGLNMAAHHATLRRSEDGVSIEAIGQAVVFVNGQRVAPGQPIVLEQGSRVVFGNHHVFRFNDPAAAAAAAAARGSEAADAADVVPEIIDWEFAQRELMQSQVAQMKVSEREKELQKEAEEKQHRMAAEIARLEQQMRDERAAAEKALASQREQLVEAAADDQDLLAREAELSEKARLMEQELERQRAALAASQRQARQSGETEAAIARVLSLTAEANAIASEMKRSVRFALKLETRVPDARGLSPLEELRQAKQIEVGVAVTQPGHEWFWSEDKLSERLEMMRQVYEGFIDGEEVEMDEDPFYDEPTDQRLGRCHMYLQSLSYNLDYDDWIPLTDARGASIGELRVKLLPCSSDGDTDDVDFFDDPSEMLGKTLHFAVEIVEARGLSNLPAGRVYIAYCFYAEEEETRVPALAGDVAGKTRLDFGQRHIFTVTDITPSFMTYVDKDALAFDLYLAAAIAPERRASNAMARHGAAAAAAAAGSKQLVSPTQRLADALPTVAEAEAEEEAWRDSKTCMHCGGPGVMAECKECRGVYCDECAPILHMPKRMHDHVLSVAKHASPEMHTLFNAPKHAPAAAPAAGASDTAGKKAGSGPCCGVM